MNREEDKMSIDALEKRVMELEVRLSFQDSTIETLNGVVTEHQQKIYQLSEQVKLLKEQMAATPTVEGAHVKPPHY